MKQLKSDKSARWSTVSASVSRVRRARPDERPKHLLPRVVIVDDDALLRESVSFALRGRCETIGLSSGTDLEGFLENSRADLLILDVTMPGRDGFELCRSLRAWPRWRALPVLFLTGRGGEAAYERFLAVQGNAYLIKPFNTNEFIETVVRLLPPEP